MKVQRGPGTFLVHRPRSKETGRVGLSSYPSALYSSSSLVRSVRAYLMSLENSKHRLVLFSILAYRFRCLKLRTVKVTDASCEFRSVEDIYISRCIRTDDSWNVQCLSWRLSSWKFSNWRLEISNWTGELQRNYELRIEGKSIALHPCTRVPCSEP